MKRITKANGKNKETYAKLKVGDRFTISDEIGWRRVSEGLHPHALDIEWINGSWQVVERK